MPQTPRLKTDHGKLRRVRLEFEDGHAQELVGDDAAKWLRAVDGAVMSAQIHGIAFPYFRWKSDCDGSCGAAEGR